MNRGMPSMVALLGLLAVAGFQNRDKIAEALGGLNKAPAVSPAPAIRQPPRAACSASWAGSSAAPPRAAC